MYQQVIGYNDITPTLGDLVEADYQIFNDWWTTYINEHKQELCRKIEHRYYFDRIGAETPDRFKWYINQKLEEIMPYYNQLYASELIKINPLLNHAITTSGRDISNLIKTANTKNDRYAKAIRDFVEQQSGLTTGTVTGEATSQNVIDKAGKIVYNKHGEEDENSTSHDTSDKTGERKIATVEDTTDNVDETINIDGTVTKKIDGTVTTDSTSKDVTDGTTTQTTDGTEKVDTSSTTDTDETIHTNTSTSGTHRKDYSDTPQKALVDQQISVRKDYLTNVTWDTDSTQGTTDTTDNTDTKTTGTTSTDTDETITTKTSQTVDGTGTQTVSTDETDTTTTKENTTKDSDRKIDKTIDTTENTTENTVADGEDKTTKDWEEHGGQTETGTTTQNTTNNTTSNRQGTSNEQRKANTEDSEASGSEETSESVSTEDTGRNQTQTGFMNVSASALLNAFRNTFLNVDKMIIDELRDCFMTIY